MEKEPIKLTKEVFSENYAMITQDEVKQTFKGLSYLPWAKSWRMLKEKDPDADYEALMNENGFIWEQLGTYFVRTQVTAFGEKKQMWLPIMDNNHYAVKLEPYDVKLKNSTAHVEAMDSRHVGDALMRCLVKNIAMFGIGLKIYEGEDVPKESENSSELTKQNKESKLSPQEKLTNLCRDVIESDKNLREKVINILKQYDEKGNSKNLKASDAKKAYKEIEILIKKGE